MKIINPILFLAAICIGIASCSSSDDSGNGDNDDNESSATQISIKATSDNLIFGKGDVQKLTLKISNIPSDFTPSKISIIPANYEEWKHHVNIGNVLKENNSYTVKIADNSRDTHYMEELHILYEDSITETISIKSAHYDEQVVAKQQSGVKSVNLTERLHTEQAPKEGAYYQLTFTAEKSWEIFATINDEEATDIAISEDCGMPGKHTVNVYIPENTSDFGRNIKFDIVYKNNEEEAATRSGLGNAIMNGLYYAFTTFAVAQTAYYDILRLDHIHFDNPGGLADALREKYACDDDELATIATELYINGPMNEDDFEFVKENLTNIRVLNLLNADITDIPEFALEKCSTLKYIVLPLKLQSIGRQAFYKTGLQNASIVMPPLLSSIGASAFEDTNISGSIYFTGASSTVNIGGYAFASTGISMIFFGEGVSTINSSKYGVALSLGMVSIAYLYLPSTLNHINNYFFNASDGYGIARIDCNASTPPTTYGHFAVDKVGCLFIPFYAYDAYLKNSYWQKFDTHNKMLPVLF